MNLKQTLIFFISFLALTFFVHEIHDWAHTLVARVMSGCWPPRAFDNWQFCVETPVSLGEKALATIAGPLINLLLLYIGWQKMNESNSEDQQSLGCCLVFAALPLNNLMAAASGGGDLTTAIRLGFARYHNNHVINLIGLAIMLLFCVPPVIRAFTLLPWRNGKLVFFPLLLIAPGYVDRWLVNVMLNKWLINASTPKEQAYWWILAWGALTLTILLLTYKSLTRFISDQELPI